jgi:hypothetical protein
MRSNAKCYDDLRAYLETVPLVDCHDHSNSDGGFKDVDPIHAIQLGYFFSDLLSASSEAEMAFVMDGAISVEERWPRFEKIWKRTCHTGYAQVVRRSLKHFYGVEEITLAALQAIAPQRLDFADPAVCARVLDEANIAVRLTDNWPDTRKILDGSYVMPPRAKLMIPLPGYHNICSADEVQKIGALVGRTVTSLGEYLEACRAIFDGFQRYGAVGFKDQCAYSRSLDFGNPTFAEAEAVFNWLMADPRRRVSYPDGNKALDDFLFHSFLRMARDMGMPVQMHTGHMAGIRNEITKTNAVLLTPVIELHRDVRFDLFHANWPYGGEWLYLCKNYPNVSLDFCWANIIDPVYCQQLFKQALSSVPHGKIHGYGTDMGNQLDRAWAHAAIARDNIAIALSEMVEMDYLNLDDAKQVAHDWLFGNANAFFGLELAGV